MIETRTRMPFVDVVAQNREVGGPIRVEVERLFESGSFVNGPQVAAFERAYARHARRRWCVGVANGTDALQLALTAVGVGPGDEVIVPAQTFVATAEAVALAGATPVVVDTDPVYHLIDPDRVAERIGPHTRAIVPVHLFGQMAPMLPLLELAANAGLAIVEDAAQAHGASQDGRRPGSATAAACTSFYPSKNLGGCGDGGAVLTDVGAVARTIERVRDHGLAPVHEQGLCLLARNSRLDCIQAVILSAKLSRLDIWNEARRAAAQRYHELLREVPQVVAPRTAPGNVHVWHLYPVLVPADVRDALVCWLDQAGIGCGVHYRDPVHLHPNLKHLSIRRDACPNAEATTRRLLSLPMHPHLTPRDQERVVTALVEGLDHVGA
jgi:dTDP-4-amino-4,6-dideoxygalactose transaminase